MVLPFVNMTIKGATWFQGENNCAECDARCDGTGKDKCHGATDPANVCGNILGGPNTRPPACSTSSYPSSHRKHCELPAGAKLPKEHDVQVRVVAGLRFHTNVLLRLQRTAATRAIST